MNLPKVLLTFLSLSLGLGLIWLCIIKEETPTLNKMTKYEKIMARSAQEYLMTRDPATGEVPTEKLVEARKYKDNLMKKLNKQKAKIPMLSWTGIGPDTVGGRSRAIMFDPTDVSNKRVFAAGTSGGLWRNNDITNKATTWTKVNDFMDNLTIVSLAYDPTSTSTWYAATGEIETSVTPGIGVFKSTDAGVTWSHLPNSSAYKFNSDIVVRNEGGTGVIYLGSGNIYIGDEIGDPVTANGKFVGTSGLFRSADGGTTWTQVLEQSNSNNQLISDLRIDGNNNLLAATGKNEFDDLGGDLYKCSGVNCNGAGSFTKIYDGSGKRTLFSVAASDQNTIYIISQSTNENSGSDDIGYFKKTINGGTTWTDITIPKVYDINNNPCTEGTNHFSRAQAFYCLVLEVHPSDPDVVLLGGIDMYRSINGGTSFSIISSWVRDNSGMCSEYMHADHHAAVFRPGNTNEVVFGNDGGIAYSPNVGDKTNTNPTFQDHVLGYVTSQFYSADISPTLGAKEYLGGLQDNGSNEWDAANNNLTVEVTGGDGGVAHIDQTQGNIQVTATTMNSYNFTEDDWASSALEVTGGTMTGRFINPTDYDDTNNILYGGSNANQISRASGFGTGSAALTDGITVNLDGGQASTIKVDPVTPTTIYIGTEAGKLFKVMNANSGTSLTSTALAVTGVAAGAYTSSIDIQKDNANHILVTYSNFGISSVFESTDGGSSWTDLDAPAMGTMNIPDLPVRWGIFNPANSDQVLLGTDLGIWTTDNINGTTSEWEATNDGLANVRIDMIKYRTSDNTFVAGTHGRGMYIGRTSSSNCNVANTTDVKQVDIAVNATIHNGHITSGALTPNNVNVNANNVTLKGAVDVILNPEFEVTTPNVLIILREDCPN